MSFIPPQIVFSLSHVLLFWLVSVEGMTFDIRIFEGEYAAVSWDLAAKTFGTMMHAVIRV